MLLLFASAFLLSTAHAASPSSVEATFANYGWERVDPDHAVALAVFQWRLEHQYRLLSGVCGSGVQVEYGHLLATLYDYISGD